MITYVFPEEVTLDDLAWIRQDNESKPEVESMSTDEVMKDMGLGKLHMLRWAEGQGIVLFRATTAGRIEVTRVIGEGQIWHWQEVLAKLAETAREWGCSSIETLVHDKRVVAALTRFGAKVDAVLMVLEIES